MPLAHCDRAILCALRRLGDLADRDGDARPRPAARACHPRRYRGAGALRRNTDRTLPATHTVEITFKLPADFPFGGISNVPGILMKQGEQTRGVPLAGLAIRLRPASILTPEQAIASISHRHRPYCT
jgi:hypothetical protein